MYEFVDTISESSKDDKPTEAMTFNGILLEDQIPGYRTLWVSGRESLETEIKEDEIGLRNGAFYRGKRHTTRDLKVGFQLLAESSQAFRLAFNILNQYLNQGNARAVFADEPDKFFTVNSVSIDDVPEGTDSVTGVITLHCSDPYKYSLETKQVSGQNGIITIDYMGTKSVPVVLEAVVNSDNGYVGFTNDSGHALQFGTGEEVDKVKQEASETLLAINMTEDDTQQWSFGDGVFSDAYGFAQYGQYENVIRNYPDTGQSATQHCVHMRTRGQSNRLWNGIGLRRQLGPDSSGRMSFKNGFAYWRLAIMASMEEEQGITQIGISDKNKQPLAAITFIKNSLTDKIQVELLIGTTKVKTDIQMNCNGDERLNQTLGFSNGHFSITKSGSTITFGMGRNYTFDAGDYGYSGFADREIADLNIFIGALTNTDKAWPQIKIQDVYKAAFRADNVEYTIDVPNRFLPGTVIQADTGTGEVKINGQVNYDSGAIGNQYEGFELHPGRNTIRCHASDFAEGVYYSAYYREAYI